MSEHVSIWRKLLIVPPLIVGIAFVVWQVGQREPPAVGERSEPVTPVRVVEAVQLNVVPVAEGYGPVSPARVWHAIAQVSGRVVETHPDLGNGSILTQDTLLLRIDAVDYELELARIDAELAELDVQASNTRASLEIETRQLRLSEQELERVRQLVTRGSAAQSEADAAERTALAARAQLQNLENSLALLPAKRRVLEARHAQAQRDIDRTTLSAPFDLRVADVAVETGQYVTRGQKLLAGDSVARVEVVAQVSMASLRKLVLEREEVELTAELMQTRLAELTGFRPQLELDLGNHTARWDAQFVRISDAVDAETRTVGVVVAVDDPFGLAIPGRRPPLSKGMFVKAVIRGRPQADRVVVPRHAVRGGEVWLVDQDERLRRRPVEVAFEQQGISVIAAGLEGGERIVVSDVVPRIEGMRLEPRPDAELARTMRAGAGAQP